MAYIIALLLTFFVLESVSANEPAAPCNTDQCALPNCYCSTIKVPAGVTDITEYPQIVMLSFDDDVNTINYYDYYQPLFNVTNKDGCPIGLTFFLSHDYTDYTLVNDMWTRGYEFASHSISHETPTTYWATLDYQGWVNQMYGLKQTASYLANIPIDDIVGSRAPFLQIGGDVMMQALYDYKFEYESSMPSLTFMNPPLNPYTFDYKSIQDCDIEPCPVDSYPGVWEVPMIDYNATYPCSMLDACTDITGVDGTFDFLLDNFNMHYQTNRAPFGLFTHSSWFQSDPTHYDGYVKFINYALSLGDVYIVTVKKMLEWMKSPTKLVDLPNFQPWACPKLSSTCAPRSCYYSQTTPGGERYMESCVRCPPNYPWVGDPYGNATASK